MKQDKAWPEAIRDSNANKPTQFSKSGLVWFSLDATKEPALVSLGHFGCLLLFSPEIAERGASEEWLVSYNE